MLFTICLWIPLLAQSQEKITFDGQVMNAVTGEPVRKALLTLEPTGKGDPVSAAAGLDGKFLFADVPPGAYQLQVRKEGFVAITIGSKGGPPGLREPLVFASGDRKTAYTVKLTPRGVITGRVLDTDGDPIRGIPVAALSCSIRAIPNSAPEWDFARFPNTVAREPTNPFPRAASIESHLELPDGARRSPHPQHEKHIRCRSSNAPHNASL